jgi:hypothetical protein
VVLSNLLVTDNCRRVKGVWLCFGGGGCVAKIYANDPLLTIFFRQSSAPLLDMGKLGVYCRKVSFVVVFSRLTLERS